MFNLPTAQSPPNLALTELSQWTEGQLKEKNYFPKMTEDYNRGYVMARNDVLLDLKLELSRRMK